MNENIVLFLKKFSEDAALQEKFKTITDPDEAYALASSIQGGFTKDEFVEAMTKLNEQLDEQELTDEDLAKTAGGGRPGDYADENLEYLPAMIGITAGGLVLAIGGATAAGAA